MILQTILKKKTLLYISSFKIIVGIYKDCFWYARISLKNSSFKSHSLHFVVGKKMLKHNWVREL